MNNTGLSFSPTDDANDPNKPKGSGNPVQDAIQLLSFRLPSFLGASAPTAPGLMGGAGGQPPSALGSQIGGGVVQEWLKRFFGGQGGPSLAGMPGGGQAVTNPNPVFGLGPPDQGGHVGNPAPRPPSDPNAPPARTATVTPTPTYTPPTPPQQRTGGTFQDWPDTRLGGSRNQ